MIVRTIRRALRRALGRFALDSLVRPVLGIIGIVDGVGVPVAVWQRAEGRQRAWRGGPKGSRFGRQRWRVKRSTQPIEPSRGLRSIALYEPIDRLISNGPLKVAEQRNVVEVATLRAGPVVSAWLRSLAQRAVTSDGLATPGVHRYPPVFGDSVSLSGQRAPPAALAKTFDQRRAQLRARQPGATMRILDHITCTASSPFSSQDRDEHLRVMATVVA